MKMYYLACNLDIIKLSRFRERSEKEKLSVRDILDITESYILVCIDIQETACENHFCDDSFRCEGLPILGPSLTTGNIMNKPPYIGDDRQLRQSEYLISI